MRYFVRDGSKERILDITRVTETELRVELETTEHAVRLLPDPKAPDHIVHVWVNEQRVTVNRTRGGFEVNGKRVASELQSEHEQKWAPPRERADTSSELRLSPMPGRVLSVSIQPGDEVTKQTVALVIEAMKMENQIFPASAGVIEQVLVAAGDAVEVGTPLFKLKGAP